MASFTITTTADQDAAIKFATDQYNADTGQPPLTPAQYAKVRFDHLLNSLVERWKTLTQTSKAQAYAKASASDQAQVDAILAKYQ